MSKIQIIMRVLSDDGGVLEDEATIEYQRGDLLSFPEYREAIFKQAERLLCRKLGFSE